MAKRGTGVHRSGVNCGKRSRKEGIGDARNSDTGKTGPAGQKHRLERAVEGDE
jgi:hypothetical protein